MRLNVRHYLDALDNKAIQDLKNQLIDIHKQTNECLESCHCYESMVNSFTDTETINEALNAGILD